MRVIFPWNIIGESTIQSIASSPLTVATTTTIVVTNERGMMALYVWYHVWLVKYEVYIIKIICSKYIIYLCFLTICQCSDILSMHMCVFFLVCCRLYAGR